MVDLIVVDLGHTTGAFTGDSTSAVLRELSPLTQVTPFRIAETVRCLLHRAPELTDELVGEVCQRLLIPPAAFPTTWERGYRPYEHTARALDELRRIAPVVALSNMSVAGGPERVAAVKAAHGSELAEVYTSYRLGGTKPEPWLWHTIAAHHGTNIGHVVHIGDRVDADVYGALCAGARVVHLPQGNEPTLYPHGSEGRVFTAHDLLDAVPVVRAWAK